MFKKDEMVSREAALPGRDQAIFTPVAHYVNHNKSHVSAHLETAYFAMGCFWGAERLFWQQTGVVYTAVGYSGGYTENPTYEEVCTGLTGHTEMVQVIFDPSVISYQQLLVVFWEKHNPSQGMRQGNDSGSQYRSAIYTTRQPQLEQAEKSVQVYQKELGKSGLHEGITTEVKALENFYYAEEYHQQYLGKNPEGYCGLGGSGVCFPPEALT